MRQIDPLVHSRSTCFAKSCERSGIERIQHGAFFLFFNYQRNAEHPNYFRDELWMKRPLLPEPICVVACTQFTATELGSTAIELPTFTWLRKPLLCALSDLAVRVTPVVIHVAKSRDKCHEMCPPSKTWNRIDLVAENPFGQHHSDRIIRQP
jgi:hypothetical protein